MKREALAFNLHTGGALLRVFRTPSPRQTTPRARRPHVSWCGRPADGRFTHPNGSSSGTKLRQLALLLLLLSGLLSACGPLERQDVPVSMSFRLDDAMHDSLVRADLRRMQAFGIRHLMLELIVEPQEDSLVPKINRTSLVNLSRLLDMKEVQAFELSIMLNHANFRPLFPSGDTLPPATTWFAHYRGELIDLMERLDGQPLRWFVIGARFSPFEEGHVTHWAQTKRMLARYTDAGIAYTALAERVPQADLWPVMDAIGVAYEAGPTANVKRDTRERNYAINPVAKAHQLPVLITHTNCIGKDKLLKFKNRLRFWDERVRVAGVNANNLYGVSVLSDTTEYFGWRDHPELREWMQDYHTPPKPAAPASR